MSGPEYVEGAVHANTPEAASAPTNVTVTASRYQPPSPRSGTAAVEGGVASYLSVATAGTLFPAWSVHAPATCAAAPSGPEYVAPEHEASPEVASDPLTFSVTGWLYQPFASGARAERSASSRSASRRS